MSGVSTTHGGVGVITLSAPIPTGQAPVSGSFSLAPGISGTVIAAAGLHFSSLIVSVTGAQPVAVQISFDYGVTWSTLPVSSIASLTLATTLPGSGSATGYRFVNNNGTTNTTIQYVGATVPT